VFMKLWSAEGLLAPGTGASREVRAACLLWCAAVPARGEYPRCEEDEWLGARPKGKEFVRLGDALTLNPKPSNKLCIPYTAVLFSCE
jgi:hypothetical protein